MESENATPAHMCVDMSIEMPLACLAHRSKALMYRQVHARVLDIETPNPVFKTQTPPPSESRPARPALR